MAQPAQPGDAPQQTPDTAHGAHRYLFAADRCLGGELIRIPKQRIREYRRICHLRIHDDVIAAVFVVGADTALRIVSPS